MFSPCVVQLSAKLNTMLSDLLRSTVRAAVPRPIRTWLRSPSRSIEWLWDAACFSLGRVETLQLAPTWSVRLHPHAYRVACRYLLEDPEQKEEFQNFLAHCREGMAFFDIGAHFGLFTLAATHFGARFVAVDPSPLATKIAISQLKLNGVEERVQVIQAAVSDAPGSLLMLSSGVFSNGYFRLVKGRSPRELTRTEATTIDRLAQQFGPPTHIKIDVEGHEAAVLRGGRDTLKSAAPVLFLELHNELIALEGGNPADALAELEQAGYAVFSLHGEPLGKSTLLQKPIIRVVAQRVR